MRIAIVGAGAIGGVLAGYLLSRDEHEVSLMVRGAHLEAIRQNGLTVHSRGEILHSRPPASDNLADLGKQDLLICTVKAHGLAAVAEQIGPMRDTNTPIVFIQNGVPWWFFYGLDGQRGDVFDVTDPGGTIWHNIGPENAIGATAHLPSEITSPGVVTHRDGPIKLRLGAPWQGQHREALAEICNAMISAGIDAAETDIRRSVWEKLRMNTGRGSLAVLTGATIGQLTADPEVRKLSEKIIDEVVAVAGAWGTDIASGDTPVPAGTFGHKSSILQDFEAGRSIEIDSIVASVVELARRKNIPVPMTEAMLALMRLKIELRDKG
ncbi:hypothetical protein Q669_27930 [Labrenzia sp. C1B10]|uniref:ketopantoate reductase family protein n=1 Tax=unclassified Labrenzia TaxID=2648686 RepID=UPI0003B7FFA7|nr:MULTISPECIES: 2-dehydropantoate 2-reductase [unclassified Labrenzia]ERP96690.1 hypothetical protein Q669_27930 [Labrenzia sp. C1B10]ERS03547.1 hypothetical protein Q675_31235 [Labrenzia sp. C1B70]